MDYTQYFERKTRAIYGTEFTCLTDNAPEPLRELIREIHFGCFEGCLPNDWIYETCFDAFDALKVDCFDDCTIEGDDYTNTLIQWLNNPFALDFCDEVLNLSEGTKTMWDVINEAQREAKWQIYYAVNEFIKEQGE